MKNSLYRLFQNSGLIIVSLGLLFGGITLVQTQIAFWNLVYGLPAIFLGIVTTLITFNELTKNQTAKASEYHFVSCLICKKQTLAPLLIERVTCPDCQQKIAVKLQLGVLVFFALVALPVTFHVAQQFQDNRQNAKETVPLCEAGKWAPITCQCGVWKNNLNCGENETARDCKGTIYCCLHTSDQTICYPKSNKTN